MNVPTISRRDVLAPANFVSLAGLLLTIYGAVNITTLSGVVVLGIGRFIDVFDGKVARATHASPFGALVDATCDKIGIAVLLPAVWIAGIAPYWLLVYIALQNILNIILNWLTAARGGTPASSKTGKYAMFAQNVSLGFYALGNTIDSHIAVRIGLLIGIASIYWAIKATIGYARKLPTK